MEITSLFLAYDPQPEKKILSKYQIVSTIFARKKDYYQIVTTNKSF
jgi:hypothetical protein